MTAHASRAKVRGMTTKTPRRPRDANQLAKRIVDLATGEATESTPVDDGKGVRRPEMKRAGLSESPARVESMLLTYYLRCPRGETGRRSGL